MAKRKVTIALEGKFSAEEQEGGYCPPGLYVGDQELSRAIAEAVGVKPSQRMSRRLAPDIEGWASIKLPTARLELVLEWDEPEPEGRLEGAAR